MSSLTEGWQRVNRIRWETRLWYGNSEAIQLNILYIYFSLSRPPWTPSVLNIGQWCSITDPDQRLKGHYALYLLFILWYIIPPASVHHLLPVTSSTLRTCPPFPHPIDLEIPLPTPTTTSWAPAIPDSTPPPGRFPEYVALWCIAQPYYGAYDYRSISLPIQLPIWITPTRGTPRTRTNIREACTMTR